MIGFIVIQLTGIVNSIIIIIISNTGSLKNFLPRRRIEIFVYIGWIVYCVEVAWDIYSTYAIFSPQVKDEELTNCTSFVTGLTVYKAVVLSHWGIVIIVAAIFIFLLDPLNCCLLSARFDDIDLMIQDRESGGENGIDYAGVHRNPFNCALWCRRCFNSSNARKNALNDLVHLFRVIFDGNDTEYTYLDLFVGLRLQLIHHAKLRSSGKDPTHLIKRVRSGLRFVSIYSLI